VADDSVRQVLALYPKIFFACHTRHVRDPKTRRILSAHQASILDHLDAVEPVNLKTLAQHMGVTLSTMSLSIDRLARGGYVLRSRDARDGRRVNLRLTPAGVRIKEAKSVLDPGRVRGMLRRLSETSRKEVLRGLALLARAAQEFMDTGGARWPSTGKGPSPGRRGRK
jgi:MarR family transcriptional regulator, organic hydroperoxide resistance regulator